MTTADIRFLLTDVDDTLTTDGRLLPETLQALYDLSDAGIKVIPVTGGCAGWCDQMIRTWPVAAVIGENGAFCFTLDQTGRIEQHYWGSLQQQQAHQQTLLTLAEQVLHKHPHLKLARDQAYRLADVAIDYNQDVSGTRPQQLTDVIAHFTAAGANARASSIHVNAWIGDYSKRTMAERLLAQRYQLSPQAMLQQAAYVGDAPNDEPMFAWLNHSWGVANIARHLPTMTHHPAQLLSQPGGKGFAELATLLITARQA